MMRQRFEKIRCWKPSIGAMIALLVIVGGAAFAILQSQAKLSGNSIETDSASLVISQDDITYSNAATGYKFSHVIPGSQPSQTEHFFLRNVGATPLALKVGTPSAPVNPDGVDLSKVNVILTPYDTATRLPGTTQDFTLQSLADTSADGGAAINYPAELNPGAIEEFDIQVSMDADAVIGSGAVLSNIDLSFTGVAVAAN